MPREPTIPLWVLRDRGQLSIHQALARWLCDDADGPQLSHSEAAAALGLRSRQEISVHLARARARATPPNRHTRYGKV